jgi:hypothetical protein
MAMHLMLELRAKSRELVETGGVQLTPLDWVRLGEHAGVPRRRQMPIEVRDAWLAGTRAAPALLELVEGTRDRYTLSSAHERELALLIGRRRRSR